MFASSRGPAGLRAYPRLLARPGGIFPVVGSKVMKTMYAKTALTLLGLLLMTSCTKTAVERQVGSENTYNINR